MIDITRSAETPPSLERQTDTCLRAEDVLTALHADFAGKCYLCERAHPLPVYEVDHRRPKNVCPAHHFSWANLFPICEACKRRSKAWPEGGLLRASPQNVVEPSAGPSAEVKERSRRNTRGISSAERRRDRRSGRCWAKRQILWGSS